MTNIMINSLSNAIQDAIIEKLRQMGEIHYNLTRFTQVQVHLQLKNLLVSSPYPLNFSNSYISTLFFKTPRNLFVVILDT